MTRQRIYLLRHGAVEYFPVAGAPADGVRLTDDGRRQAAVVGEALRDVPFDRVVTSSSARARETAGIVLDGRDLKAEECSDLAEIASGRLREIPEDRLERAFVDALGPGISRRSRFLGGETFGAFVDRVIPALQRLCEEPGWTCLLLVLHGAVNRAILAHALGLPLQSFGALEQDACCINIIDIGPRGPIVRLVNHTPYDPVKRNLTLTSMESLYREYRCSGAY